MGWLTPRRSRSFAGSQGAEISRRGGGPSRVPARVVLLLLAMVAALAGQAFAQTTPNPGDRWTPGGVWTHDVTTTSLIARLTPQQSVTIDGGSRQWANAAIDACPWTTVTRPLPSTTCTELKAYNANGFPNYNPLTLTNFAPTQTMIDNGGVVIRLRWRNYNSPAGNNVGMVEWVPLVPPLGATLVLTPASISENAGVSTVTATLNQATSAATTVTVSAAAVAPAVAGDFALSTNKILTIAASATTSTGVVTITASNNGLDAPDKSVTVSGTVSGGNGAAAPSDVTLTITDDDALPTVTLGLSPSSVSESSGVSTVTATLSGASSEAVTVTVAAAAGTGAVAADFTLSGTTELTIAARETTSTGTVTVTANGNTVDSPDKSVTVSGTVTGGNNIAAPSNVTLTLTDDETLPTLTLALSSSSVSESGGVSTVTATLSGVSSEAVTVTVGAAAGAGAVAGDFSLSSADKLTIAAGSTTSTGPVTVTANGNTVDSPDKSVTVSGTVSGGNGVAAPSSVTLTITDDDALPTALVLTPASISEDGGVSTVTATLNRALSVAVTVTVSASPGAGTDFTLSSAPELTIAAGATTSTSTGTAVTITANDNDVEAPDKSVTVSGTATATGEDVEDPPDVTLTLLDDDMAGFVFEPSGSLTVAAGGAASTYTAKLSSEPTGAVTVSIASDNGDVTVDPSSLTFDAANWGTAQTVTVTAAADGDDYADTATLSHRGEGGGYDGVKEGVLSAAVAGGARIAASGGGSGTPRVYVVNGHLVTVTEEADVPPGVEIDLASSNLAEDVSVTLKPVRAGTPQESGSFSLKHSGARVMVDVDVTPAPEDGVKLCLTPPAGMRDAARRASGRDVELLHYTGGSWTAVKDSAWDESRSQVCGTVTTFSDFSAGYARTKPVFEATQPALVFTVNELIDPVETLPEAKGGNGTLLYALTPALPPGLAFDETSRTLSGTPTEALDRTTYSLTATDSDGDETEPPLTFTIEVKPALAEARARLKRINESVLPELSRALWGSAMDAVTGRLESPDAAAPTAADGLERAAGFVRANEGALEEGDMSWKELLGGESFAFGLAEGEGGSGFGGVVAWGSGDWRRLSRDEDALDWSGDAFSAHVGADAALRPGLRAGLAASWFASDVDYTDRSQGEAITGSHESRMTSLTPYVGWDGGDGTRLWGAAGYGQGEIEIVDEDLLERFGAQKADSRFLAGAAGGSARVWSEGALTVDAKASGEATRFEAKDNGSAIAGVTVETRRLRVAAEGSRAYALADGASLTPTLEAGVRWDGGDGATGAGLEAGGGLSWSDPSRGLTVEATGRALLVHNSDVEEWGASGAMRLAPDADGSGLSFRLLPSWGVSGSGMARLWNEGVAAARPADGGGGNRARLETELGYGLPAFAGAGVTTPYAGVGLAQGGERDMRAGVRVGLGAGFELGIETARRETTANTGHGIGIDLRMRW